MNGRWLLGGDGVCLDDGWVNVMRWNGLPLLLARFYVNLFLMMQAVF